MSRSPTDPDREQPGDPDEPEGSWQPTSPVVLAVWAVVGLAGGWLTHPLSERLGTAPLVAWAQPTALFLVATILGATAYATHRTVQVRRQPLDSQQAVNRLVLARACALVGALVGGGYVGYGLSWIGSAAELAGARIVGSAVAALAGVLIVVAALVLERSCRIPGRGDRS